MVSLATKHNDPEVKLGWGERIGYGLGACGWNMINGIIATFLTVYFTNVALLDAAIISTIIAVSKVFDGVSDLIVGNIVDRTQSKYGKARVWLLRMCVPFAICLLLLFWVPASWPSALKYVYVFIMYNLVNAVCLTFMQVPYYSLISLMTRNSEERGMLGNIQQIFQTLGNIIINTFFVVLLSHFSSSATTENTQAGYTGAIAVVVIAMVIMVLFTVFNTKERTGAEEAEATEDAPQQKRGDEVKPMVAIKSLLTNKYWVTMFFAMLCIFFVIIFYSVGGVYYALYIFNDMGQISWMNNAISIAQFAIMFVTPFFMKKVGKRWIYAAGMACLTLGFLGFGLFGTSKIIMIICNALKGIGLGMAGGMAMGLVADSITYGELKTGVNAVGMGNAGASAAQKLGLGLGTAIFGWVLSAAGFKGEYDVQGIPQPDTVATAIKFMYNWVPMIMCAIIFLVFLLTFNLDRDLKRLRAEKGIDDPALEVTEAAVAEQASASNEDSKVSEEKAVVEETVTETVKTVADETAEKKTADPRKSYLLIGLVIAALLAAGAYYGHVNPKEEAVPETTTTTVVETTTEAPATTAVAAETEEVFFQGMTVRQDNDGTWRAYRDTEAVNVTSVLPNQYGWWYVKDGVVDFDYTGVAENAAGQWYIENGKVDFSANGEKVIGGTAYQITDGKVQ